MKIKVKEVNKLEICLRPCQYIEKSAPNTLAHYCTLFFLPNYDFLSHLSQAKAVPYTIL